MAHQFKNKLPTLQNRLNAALREVREAVEKENAAQKALKIAIAQRDALQKVNETTVSAAMTLADYQSGLLIKAERLIKHRTFLLFLSWATNIIFVLNAIL